MFEHEFIVHSAPFGLITNRAQENDLFPEVFLEDLKSWKSISTTVPNILTTSSTTTNLTILDIVDSIRRYFIHKTGIEPKHWVMPYIEQQLRAIYSTYKYISPSLSHNGKILILGDDQNLVDNPFYVSSFSN